MSLQEKRDQLLKRLKVEMNGAVVGDMRGRGIQYGLNYGVSIPTIKEIAKTYAPDHELAEKIFSEGDVRELKIAAVYIDTPSEVTADQMWRWAKSLENEEIANIAIMNLFYLVPSAFTVATEWISERKSMLIGCGVRLSGKMMTENMCTEKQIISIIELISEIESFKDRYIASSAIYTLCRAHEVSPTIAKVVQKNLEIIKTKTKGEHVASEVLAFC